MDELGEGDVGHVHVEAHADRVGGDQMLDLAGLVHRDLGVARARREGAQDDGGPALLAPDDLGQAVDLGGGEGDDRTAARQPVQLAVAGEGEDREAGAADHLGLGHQPPQDRADGVRAKEHGLLAAARVQQAIGEHVAALVIGGELDLVDGEERHLALHRHGLDRADEIGRVLGAQLLLARDQGAGGTALDGHDPIEDLAGEQAEREADHARAVGQHALDGKVRLTGIGRPENRHHPTMERTLQNHVRKIAAVPAVGKAHHTKSAPPGRSTQHIVAEAPHVPKRRSQNRNEAATPA